MWPRNYDIRSKIFCSLGEEGGDKGGGGGGDKGGGDPWYQPHVANLDKDTLAWLDGKKFADPVSALKSGALADKMARERNVLNKPDPAKLGEWDGWEALGFVPDEAKYKAGIKPPKMPNDAQHDAALLDSFAKLAHGLKLPPAMAEQLYHGLTGVVNERLTGIEAAGAKATADLQVALDKKWGTDKDVNTEIAKRAMRTLKIGADDAGEIEKIIGSPRLMELFHTLGTGALEGKLISDDSGGGPKTMTPATAAAELRRLEGDPAWMKVFTDPAHPQQADYAAQRMALIEAAAKGKKAA
jgi:hypothetical protein